MPTFPLDLIHEQTERDLKEQDERIEREVGDLPKPDAKGAALLVGAAGRLRGIPAVGRGVSGAIRGTRPGDSLGLNDAEDWLTDHDPDYATRSAGWKHVRYDGTYRRPRQEIPWGLADDLELLVEAGERLGGERDRRGPKPRGYVGAAERRACERCGELFAPSVSRHRFCSDRCRWAAQKKAQRSAAKRMSAQSA